MGAAFVSEDTTTLGNWIGVYGGDGAILPRGSNSEAEDSGLTPPTYLSTFTVPSSVTSSDGFVWYQHTSDVTAIQRPGGGSDRWWGIWPAGTTFTYDIVVDQPCRLALYICDYGAQTDAARHEILDSDGTTVLDSRDVVCGGYSAPVWLVWDVSGHFYLRVTRTGTLAGVNAPVFFFGPSPVGPSPIGRLVAFGRSGLVQ